MNNQDRARFVHDLYEFNDQAPAKEYDRTVTSSKHKNVGRQTSHIRERIVDIHGWKLMENHIHLLISERIEDGLSLFIQKMSGYARYFNERYKRRGSLFEGGKKVHIESETHFLYILHYIHLNGLDNFIGARGWRERDKGSIVNINGALDHLLADRWSSYQDYCGIQNFPSILTKTLFENHPGTYESEIRAFLMDREKRNINHDWLE